MLLHRESTPSGAASSGARSVPGGRSVPAEEGWAKGSTGWRLLGAPMIWVSQSEVCVLYTASAPGNMAPVSILPSPHRAERGFGRGRGGINSPGREEKYPKIPYPLFSSSESFSSQCTQERERDTGLAATIVEESDVNNNTDPEEKPQASSRGSILSRRAVFGRAGVSSRKNEDKAASSKKFKNKHRSVQAANPSQKY